MEYLSIESLVLTAENEKTTISEICLRDQAKQLNIPREEIYIRMEQSFDVMVESTHAGMAENLRSVSGLTGGEGKKMMDRAEKGDDLLGEFASRATARALSVSNCNAAMGRIVATPTAGSAGILPGVLVTLYEDRKIPKEKIVMSLFTAAAFGMVIAQRASISGAEGGCQAECGSASGMAAAAIVEILGGTPQQSADALGMSLINQLGLVCDPVAGLVEIPCIKRNASGTMLAITSASMALAGIPLYIPADDCIAAMKSVGDSMHISLKETALGGLAATKSAVEMKKKVFAQRKNMP